jgi:hypothetical protein
MAPCHKVIQIDVVTIRPEHVDNLPLDLILFDSHAWQQFVVFRALKSLITDDTVFAIHDTNYYYINHDGVSCEPFINRVEEATLVNYLHNEGYDAFSIRTLAKDHDPGGFRHRHGLTIMQKFRKLQ